MQKALPIRRTPYRKNETLRYSRTTVVAMSQRSNEKAVPDFVARRWRDNAQLRSFVLSTWNAFNDQGLAKGNFVSDLVSGKDSKLFQRLWEMVLALHLIEQGFKIQSHESGPDFSFEIDEQKVWVEATAPEPCDVIQKWLNRKGGRVPHEQILLRWTGALNSKRQRFLEYRNQGIVQSNDVCIIAINGHMLELEELGKGRGISGLPYAVEAVFPIGPFEMTINKRTLEHSDLYNSERRFVPKPSGANVSTDSFLKQENEYISAVVGCSICWKPSEYPEYREMSIVHNPFAKNRFPYERFGANSNSEYVYEFGQDEDSIRSI